MWKTSFKPINPTVILNSGASLSIQASSSHYCLPREDEGPYTHYELAHPRGLGAPDLAMLEKYEEPSCLGDSSGSGIYPYVPKEILDKIINRHGGFRVGRFP
jgi:hypothetical protein